MTSNTKLPPSINLLKVVVDSLPQIEPMFRYQSEEFKRFRDLIPQDNFSEDPSFTSNPMFVTYTQLLLLVSISMFGGLSVPDLKSLSIKSNRVSMLWKSAITTSFELGKANRDFKLFCQYVFSHVFSKKKTSESIPKSFFDSSQKVLKKYLVEVDDTMTKINTLLSRKHQLPTLINDPKNPELFFILLSSLPSEDLNQFYLHIHPFFRKDLSVKSSSGVEINIPNFFQMHTPDINLLIEKIKFHFNLYFYSDEDDVREKIRQETTAFLTKLIAKPQTLNAVIAELDAVKTQQLQMRYDLYTLFIKQLNRVSLCPNYS